jgi:hypothetical protein
VWDRRVIEIAGGVVAGRAVTIPDENHIAGARLQHECKILPGHDRGRVCGDPGGARDFAGDLHRELGLAGMVHGDGVVATVLDTSRCAVGGRDAERHVAHPTLQQIADLRLTLAACRHGGLTELGDAELTEQGVMALSGHLTPDAARLYLKRTEAQREVGLLKRRAWVQAVTEDGRHAEQEVDKSRNRAPAVE